MKKLIIAVSSAALIAGTVYAGSFEEPAVEAVEVVEEENRSAGWLIPLIAIIAVAVLISGDDDSSEELGPNGNANGLGNGVGINSFI